MPARSTSLLLVPFAVLVAEAACSQRTTRSRPQLRPEADARLAHGPATRRAMQPASAPVARATVPSVLDTRRIETKQFTLRQKKKVVSLCEANKCQLLPSKLVRCEGGAPEVDSDPELDPWLEFGAHVAAFAIGDGKIGIHLYGIKTYVDGKEDKESSGSDSTVEGCDLLLVYDPASPAVTLGRNFGVSQSRGRNGGCNGALSTHGDGLVDIGVIREKIGCEIAPAGVYPHAYEQSRVEWQVYKAGSWQRENQGLLEEMPETTLELPLLDVPILPIDYVAAKVQWPRDSRMWPAKRFVPRYRLLLGRRRR